MRKIYLTSFILISLTIGFQFQKTILAAEVSTDNFTLFNSIVAQAQNSTILLDTQGELKTGDLVIIDDKSLLDVYTFDGRKGQTITITVESDDFDSYLMLYDPQGNQYGEGDDISAEDTNSRLIITLPEDGVYEILVNGYDAQSKGTYRLTVETNP